MIRRRDLIRLLGSAAATWPLAARAEQARLPVVAFVSGRSASDSVPFGGAFRTGLNEAGVVEGQNLTVEYYWLEGQSDRLPALMADFVRARVAAIATPSFSPAALAAKAATETIPIVFGVGQDPVKMGLVASLARPGGNATGINLFSVEVMAKRLELLHELVPQAVSVVVLVNPAGGPPAEATMREVSGAAPAMGMQIRILNASTIGEIEAAFATLAREHLDALFVAADALFLSRRMQIAALAARGRIPTVHATKDEVVAGGLISYGTDTGQSPSNWHLYRTHSQRREALRPSGAAGHKN